MSLSLTKRSVTRTSGNALGKTNSSRTKRTRRNASIKPFRSPQRLSQAQKQEVVRLVRAVNVKTGAYKYYDYYLNNTGISTTPTVANIAQLVSDSNLETRDSNRILVKSLSMKLTVRPANGTPSDNSNELRIILFTWDGDTIPTYDEILDASTIADYLYAPYVARNKAAFKASYNILFDQRFFMSYSSGNNVRLPMADYFKKWPTGHPIQYAGKLATDYEKGALFILLVSDSSQISHPGVKGGIRTRFTDVN